MKEKRVSSFFAGSEEIIARFSSLFVSLAIFSVYFISRGDVNFVWYELVWVIAIFWFVYELLAFVLFSLFRFFSKKSDQDTFEPIAEIASEEK